LKVAIIPESLEKPLHFVKEIKKFMTTGCLHYFLGFDVYPGQVVDKDLVGYLYNTLVTPQIFPDDNYVFQGSKPCAFDSHDHDPWRVAFLEDQEGFEKLFRLVRVDSYYYDQCGYGDVSFYVADNVLAGFTSFLVIAQKDEK
jgi:hypothetical protein